MKPSEKDEIKSKETESIKEEKEQIKEKEVVKPSIEENKADEMEKKLNLKKK